MTKPKFEGSYYKCCDSYQEWATNLKGHKRQSIYSLPDFDDNRNNIGNELESRLDFIEYLNSQNRE